MHQAAELATSDPELKAQAIEAGMRFLHDAFSKEKTSIEVATPLHRIVRSITRNEDPYFLMKETEVAMARQLLDDQSRQVSLGLRESVILAVLGNCIDFFRTAEEVRADISAPVEFAFDDVSILGEKLMRSGRFLYLADNTGEVLFDLPLVRYMSGYGQVTYVVKESPVQNDVSLADLDYFGLGAELPRVISTGTDTPGVDMSIASDLFKSEFADADLVLAKGMAIIVSHEAGHELYDFTMGIPFYVNFIGKVFHLLKAKCTPVADSIGVPLNSYVALLR